MVVQAEVGSKQNVAVLAGSEDVYKSLAERRTLLVAVDGVHRANELYKDILKLRSKTIGDDSGSCETGAADAFVVNADGVLQPGRPANRLLKNLEKFLDEETIHEEESPLIVIKTIARAAIGHHSETPAVVELLSAIANPDAFHDGIQVLAISDGPVKLATGLPQPPEFGDPQQLIKLFTAPVTIDGMAGFSSVNNLPPPQPEPVADGFVIPLGSTTLPTLEL